MKYWGLLVSCIGALVLILILVSSSLWFLRGVLGSNEGVIEFGFRGNRQLLNNVAQGVLVDTAEHRLNISMDDFYRIVYVRDAEVEYMVGIPKISRLFGEAEAMRQGGWDTRYALWVLTATRPVGGEASGESSRRSLRMVDGLKNQVRALAYKNLPVSPLFIAHLSPDAHILDQSISVYGELISAKNLHIAITYDGAPFRAEKRLVQADSVKDGLYISIQSEIFNNISSQVLSSIHDVGAKLFRFSKTNPPIFSSFPSGTQLGIVADAENIAIGVKANGGALRDLATSWIVAEQGARHPRRRGFTLPDKTIGYEYVPTLPDIRFQPKENEMCSAAAPYDEQIFLCEKSDMKIVASQDLIGMRLVEYLSSDKNDMSGTLSEHVVEKIIPDSFIKSLSFVGDEKGVDIMATLK